MAIEYYLVHCCQLNSILYLVYLLFLRSLFVVFKSLIFNISSIYIYIYILGTLVPNSRDRHEKQWRPDFTHHKTHPKMRFISEKQTEVHF